MVRLLAAFAAVMLLTQCSYASAGEYGNKDEAVAMVERVKAMFVRDGADTTFQAVSDKSVANFHDRDLYPFIYDLRGICVAHGARPALIGKNLVYLIREMIDTANGPGSGWVNYKWPNPINNKIEDKTSYIAKMGDYFVGVGVYRE
jgi:signal transduction histidine kinase